MDTMPNVLLAPHSPAGSSGLARTLDCEGAGFRDEQTKNRPTFPKHKSQKRSSPDKKEHIIINQNQTGEKTLKPEKSPSLRKSGIRPITKKNLLAIDQQNPKMT